MFRGLPPLPHWDGYVDGVLYTYLATIHMIYEVWFVLHDKWYSMFFWGQPLQVIPQESWFASCELHWNGLFGFPYLQNPITLLGTGISGFRLTQAYICWAIHRERRQDQEWRWWRWLQCLGPTCYGPFVFWLWLNWISHLATVYNTKSGYAVIYPVQSTLQWCSRLNVQVWTTSNINIQTYSVSNVSDSGRMMTTNDDLWF